MSNGDGPGAERPPAFGILERLHADATMAGVFSERRTIERWLAVEASLARSQARVGVLRGEDAEAIAAAAVLDTIDVDDLWAQARNVGYPILPLVRMIADALPAGPDGRVHYGATTQDIMDTGLALQLSEAFERLNTLVAQVGDAIAAQIAAHRGTVMAARTHAQQAVPTTFGAVMAGFLSEFGRHRARLAQARTRICRLSLHGAGGTSAAYGPHAARIRALMAEDLGLTVSAVPWHVARDGPAEFGGCCAMLAGTSARLARDIIDLSRTEIAEVSEPASYHRGASSTMAQKSNPVWAEAIVGMAGAAAGHASALYRAMEAGHERAAGEWQTEWHCLPQLAVLSASALSALGKAVQGLVVAPEAMRRNLRADGGAVMAEAHMMALAGELGRENAHDLLYSAVRRARGQACDLETALNEVCQERGLPRRAAIAPDDYLGEAQAICDAALAEWADPPPS